MGDSKQRLPKAMSLSEFDRKEFDKLQWGERWQHAFGRPEPVGVWTIWGLSGAGKTSFALQLAKELGQHYRVDYNSLEQGASYTLQLAMRKQNMMDASNIHLISEDIDILDRRLSSKGAPDVVIIDSVQYTSFDKPRGWERYMAFREKYRRKKLIIFISQAEGKNPKGSVADDITFDSDLKIFVEGYRAISKGRFFGREGAYYTIWEEGAARYWLNK